MDPLSDVLSLLRLSYVSAGFAAGGEWLVRFARHEGIKVNAILSGSCWLAVDGTAEPVHLREGDCFILPKGRPFLLGSNLDLEPVDAQQLLAAAPPGGLAVFNGGGDFILAGSRFSILATHADVLIDALPPVVHIVNKRSRGELRWTIERMREEMRNPKPGGDLVAHHLAHLMLIEVLRQYLEDNAKTGVGWVAALADRQIGAAIGAMHADPAQRWTVETLAQHAGMSRTAFAVRFRAIVGHSPMAHLTRWRMIVAADRLERSRETVATIAASVGYESESAFAAAFKRVMGNSPRRRVARHHIQRPRRPAETAAVDDEAA
ncbi:MAG: AraC family transcriptional regulator [Devosia sp.]